MAAAAAAARRPTAASSPLMAAASDTISGPPDSTPTFAELRHFTTADRFNFAPFQYILTPSERYGGWASVKRS